MSTVGSRGFQDVRGSLETETVAPLPEEQAGEFPRWASTCARWAPSRAVAPFNNVFLRYTL